MSTRQLQLLLAAFFLALALPGAFLVYQAYERLKWESFHQHQQLARELVRGIETRFAQLLQQEENRPFTDYRFLNISGGADSAFLQRSPLSRFPPDPGVPGLLGYFQVDGEGRLNTPTVPESNTAEYGLSEAQLAERLDQQARLQGILGANRLTSKPAIPSPAQPAEEIVVEQEAASPATEAPLLAFDSLRALSEPRRDPEQARATADRVETRELPHGYEVANAPEQQQKKEGGRKDREKVSRLETVILPDPAPAGFARAEVAESMLLDELLSRQRVQRIRSFESEVYPMEFGRLDSGHFVMFRRAWQDDERFVQGLLIEADSLIGEFIAAPFRQSSLSPFTTLMLAYRGNLIHRVDAPGGRDRSATHRATPERLYQARMMTPFSDLEVILTLSHLPPGAGSRIILWNAVVLAMVLIAGVIMFYRLGSRQIQLVAQQRDFVSAVSHELKTPLTSIRMYVEMLREGWADESRRQSYYDFIHNESARLSRLINNILQLARLNRREQKPQIESIPLGALLEELRPGLETQMREKGFEGTLACPAEILERHIDIDRDWLAQVLINLVDNAIKFSAKADDKRIDIEFRLLRDTRLLISVRDHGPGIPESQMKKIFGLFYRAENEPTRETVGTGIGLALVHQLVQGMGGEIDVVNRNPGAEFQIRFDLRH